MSYAVWLGWVDRIAALELEGRMHDDFDYDWRAAYEWGEDPWRAVRDASRGVQQD